MPVLHLAIETRIQIQENVLLKLDLTKIQKKTFMVLQVQSPPLLPYFHSIPQ